jgi:hypothetical protein
MEHLLQEAVVVEVGIHQFLEQVKLQQGVVQELLLQIKLQVQRQELQILVVEVEVMVILQE